MVPGRPFTGTSGQPDQSVQNHLPAFHRKVRSTPATVRFLGVWCSVGGLGIPHDVSFHDTPPETFRIGQGTPYTPRQSGYFYAYANDAWNCYGNNYGCVRLTIS